VHFVRPRSDLLEPLPCAFPLPSRNPQERIAGSESSQLAEALAATEGEAEAARTAKEAAAAKRAEMAEMAKVRGGGPGGLAAGA
jgi:hypothetical protein